MGGRVALVVDDDPVIQRVVGYWLRDAGFALLTADTAEEALDLLHDHEIELVVTDFRLPGMDGAELSQRLQTLRPVPPHVFMMSAYPRPFDAEVERFFSKPDQLVDMIRSIAGYA